MTALALTRRRPVTPATGPPLTWPARSKHESTYTAQRRIWTTACVRYRVVEATSFFIRGRHRCRRVTITAEARSWVGGVQKHCWAPISEHRRLDKAREACQTATDESSEQ